MKKLTILSLCDFSGIWSQPYENAGFRVIRVDLKHGEDVRFFEVPKKEYIYGVISQPPCTHFAGSGARWWKKKGKAILAEGLALVDACLRIQATAERQNKRLGKELAFHVLENPVGRLPRFIGPTDYTFNPSEFGGYLNPPMEFEATFKRKMAAAGDEVSAKKAVIAWAMQWDAYTKRTCLWGNFNHPVKIPVVPVLGSILWAQYGGKSERTKEMRSMTPKGFATAFFAANNPDSAVATMPDIKAA